MQGRSAPVAFAAMGPRNKRPMLIAIGGLLAMAAGVGVGRFVYTPILPPMVEALSLSKSQAGLIASAKFVGYLAGALLASMRLAGSRRAWLLGSLAVNTFCLAAMGLTTSMPAFLALRLMAGIVSAFRWRRKRPAFCNTSTSSRSSGPALMRACITMSCSTLTDVP